MNNKTKALAVALALVAAQIVPTLAFAQYGGGGGPIGLIGVPIAPTVPQTTTTPPAGQVLGASAYNFTTNLHIGSTGEDVTQLQQILIADGYLNIAAPTGYFGSATAAAVKAYQSANGISVTGFVGPLTRAQLNEGANPTASDENQSLLQQDLQALVEKLKDILALSANT